MRKLLIFPAMTVFWFVLLVVSGVYPDAFVSGARIVFLLAVAVCGVISYIALVKYVKVER